MKRAQLIEWGIVVIALIFGYKFLEAIITFIIQLIYAFDGRVIRSEMLRIILIIGLYAVFFIVLIKYSYKIAAYLSPPGSSGNDLLIRIGKRSMLQVILIAICAITVLTNIADIIYYIFETFKSEAQRRSYLDDANSFLPGKYVFIVKSIQVVVAVVLIYISKNLSDFLIRKDEADELVFDAKPEN